MDAMTIRRGPLYVGAFLLATGAVALLNAAGLLDPQRVADAVGTFWPLAVIAIGAGLVLRRSPAALPAGLLAAAVPGLVFGGAVVAAPDMTVPCTDPGAAIRQTDTHEGTFGAAAEVDLVLDCGELRVSTAPGSGWSVDARDGERRVTDVVADGGRLSVDANRDGRRIGLGSGRVDWGVVLPTSPQLDLRTELNAGHGDLDLRGTRLRSLELDVNAGELSVDLTEAGLSMLELEVNAGAAVVTLPANASFEGDLDVNAGSLEVCAPDGLGLRVTGTTALGSTQANGLIRSGDAWETPGYDTAPFKADLAIDASLGSVTINPQGGCK
jgi:hypothetical protein